MHCIVVSAECQLLPDAHTSYLIPVLYKCAGHGGGLASAHAYCYTTRPHAYTRQRQTFQQSVVSAVRVSSYMSAVLPSLGLHHINQSLHHMPLHDLQVVFTCSVS